MSRILGIDLGTTFLKGAVLDTERAEPVHVRRTPVPAPVVNLPPTRYEIDPGSLLAAVRSLLGELLQFAPDASRLLLCSQMHCLVLLDPQLRPCSNIITWKDRRGLEPSPHGHGTLFDELEALVSPREQRRLGGEMRIGVPISTMHALERTGELPGVVWPVSLPDFVLSALCRVEPTTDATNASAYGLYDVTRRDWHRDLIARLGLDRLRWPRIRPFGEVVGMAEVDGHTLACHTPVGDQQCALAGVGLREGELSLNISTGSQVSLISRDLPEGEFQVRPYFGDRWLRTVVSVPAGRSLGVLVDLLTELPQSSSTQAASAWDYIRERTDLEDDSDLEVDLSFFPSYTGDRGGITNIREDNLTVGKLFVAAFRNMARNYARCAAAISGEGDWNEVVFSGGISQKFRRLRTEILRELGNPPSRLCAIEEDTLAGLLVLAKSLVH